MSIYHITLGAGSQTAQLRIEIPDLADADKKIKETWFCSKPEFLGEARGAVAWMGHEIGLFAMDALQFDDKKGYFVVQAGAQAYGILVIPEDGLDEVAFDQGGEARFARLGTGSWTKVR